MCPKAESEMDKTYVKKIMKVSKDIKRKNRNILYSWILNRVKSSVLKSSYRFTTTLDKIYLEIFHGI